MHPFYKVMKGLFHLAFWSIIFEWSQYLISQNQLLFLLKIREKSGLSLLTPNMENQFTILSGPNLDKQRLKKGELKFSI